MRKLRILGWALLTVLAFWLVAAIVLSLAQWACEFPWTRECQHTFFQGLQKIILLQWVDDPETLVSALLAVVAAAVGSYFLYRQITQSDAHENKRRHRAYRAAKAMTPLALSEVCDFAGACLGEWVRARDHVLILNRGVDVGSLEIELPTLSTESIAILRAIIEAAPKKECAPFVRLIRDVQVTIARTRSLTQTINSPGRRPILHSITGQMLELLELYAQAARLMPYSRGEADIPEDVRPNADDIRNAIQVYGWWEPNEPDLWEQFRLRFERDEELSE